MTISIFLLAVAVAYAGASIENGMIHIAKAIKDKS